MDPKRYARIYEIYEALQELPHSDREAALLEMCAGDAPLLAEVRSILERDQDKLPQTPPVRAGHEAQEWIGPYRLLETLGEGGMGSVHLAEQMEPIRRRVAIKLIKRGMDTQAVLDRFEAERRALAVMDHPNISRVLDAGETKDGRPYFVMELVQGEPITDYCDRNALSVSERLTLFVQICNAIQHAHQKGIIHRDLKPTNILVTPSNEGPVPKVIDFGIAKATGAALSDSTPITLQGQFVGTPEYMSPEQADRKGFDIDTRTDVYSLGMVLYELLVGFPPFDWKTIRKKGVSEMRRTILEAEAPKPSVRVEQAGTELNTVAKRRRTEPSSLIKEIRGDLDWIVLTAIDKDRTKRYAAANMLALEIQRYLDDEPIMARPPTAGYQLGKIARRHKVAIAIGATILVSLVAIAGSLALCLERGKS